MILRRPTPGANYFDADSAPPQTFNFTFAIRQAMKRPGAHEKCAGFVNVSWLFYQKNTPDVRPAIWTLLLLMTTACGQPLLVVKPNAYIRNLGISFSAGQGANEKIIAVMENHLDDFIERYNAAPKRKFNLFRAFPSDSCSIRITVFETKLVGAGQQVAGVFVSLVGISVPLLLTSAVPPCPSSFTISRR